MSKSADQNYEDQVAKLQELKKKYIKPQVEETVVEVEDTTNTVVELEPETSSEVNYEDEATRQGWISKERYKGDPKDFVDAKTYVERGEKFRKTQQTKYELDNENKKLQVMVKELVDNLKHAEERVKAQTLAELEKHKQQALQNNDLQYYRQVEQKEQEVRTRHNGEQQPVNVPNEPVKPDADEFKRFIEQGNDWATKDDDESIELRTYATLQTNKYCLTNPGASHAEQFEFVHNIVRERYPQYFGIESDTPKVYGGSTPAGSKRQVKRVDLASLTSSQRMIYEALKKDKSMGMSPEDYLKTLVK